MKRVLLGIIILALLISVIGGCANQEMADNEKGDENTEETEVDNTQADSNKVIEPFKIGFCFLTNTTDPLTISIIDNVRAVVEAAGGELIIDNMDFTNEGMINSVEKLISLGVDGILIMPLAESLLPTINQMCVEAEIPFATMFRAINDEEIKAEILSSPYFAGGCYEDEEITAYNAVKEMASLGVKNLCVINLQKGDAAGDARDRGAERAAQESGIEILTVARNLLQMTDVQKTVESFIAAYPEMDGIFIAGTYAPAALPTLMKVLEDHKLDGEIKVGRIDFDSTMESF